MGLCKITCGVCQGDIKRAFDGECDGPEIRMYEGNGDNPGSEIDRIRRCSSACQNQKPPLSGSWSGFLAKGFTVLPTNGRCYCEAQDSESCTRTNNDYDRYDLEVSACLVRSNHECKSGDEDLGKKATLQECKNAVKENKGEFFSYGINGNEGQCFKENARVGDCPDGWQADQFDFYRLSQGGCHGSNAGITALALTENDCPSGFSWT